MFSQTDQDKKSEDINSQNQNERGYISTCPREIKRKSKGNIIHNFVPTNWTSQIKGIPSKISKTDKVASSLIRLISSKDIESVI